MSIKVSFTAKEYARLLELTWLGLQVTTAGEEDAEAGVPERYAELEQKLYALARPLGCADLVDEEPDGVCLPAEKLTEGPAREALDDFIEEKFWGELVSRLAERDLRAELGHDATKLSDELDEEELEKLAPHEDAYWREFEQHGTDHLVVLRGGKG